ncbi:MAG: apolipoprotein N-acyltransferase [Porcipelethomonas sp.]
MNTKKKTIISTLSGIASAIPFIFKDLYFIIFISLAPTLYFIISDKTKAFPVIFFHLFSFYFYSDLWLFSACIEYASSKVYGYILSYFVIISISLILSLTASLPFLLIRNLKSDNPVIVSGVVAFLYILGEWLQGVVPINFPWNRLCNIAAYNPRIIQTASLFGGLFISFVIVLINLCIVYSIIFFSRKIANSVVFALLAAFIFQLNVYLGHLTDLYYSQPVETPHEVLLIQANFSRYEKRDLPPDIMLDEYLRLAGNKKGGDTELIILSETALSEKFFNDASYRKKLEDFVTAENVPILFGTSYDSGSERYNSCVILFPDKSISEIYSKRRLVPFGEYTPSIFPDTLHFVKNSFTVGRDDTIITGDFGQIGCAICFETIFPSLLSESSKMGAELFVMISNDSWLGNDVPLYQHHANSILRAVENRKYTATCANTGISSVIAPDGTIEAISERNRKQTVRADIYTNDIVTFYAKTGDIIVLPSFFIVVFLGARLFFEKYESKKQKKILHNSEN